MDPHLVEWQELMHEHGIKPSEIDGYDEDDRAGKLFVKVRTRSGTPFDNEELEKADMVIRIRKAAKGEKPPERPKV